MADTDAMRADPSPIRRTLRACVVLAVLGWLGWRVRVNRIAAAGRGRETVPMAKPTLIKRTDLPKSLQRSSKRAQDVFRSALRAAVGEHGKGKQSRRAAWGAVEESYVRAGKRYKRKPVKGAGKASGPAGDKRSKAAQESLTRVEPDARTDEARRDRDAQPNAGTALRPVNRPPVKKLAAHKAVAKKAPAKTAPAAKAALRQAAPRKAAAAPAPTARLTAATTRAELYRLASDLAIPGRSRMTRDQLLIAVRAARRSGA